MTLRHAFALVVMGLLIGIALHAKAAPSIKVDVITEQTPANTFGAVIGQAFIDNDDGTKTLEIFICGAVVQFTGNKDQMFPDAEGKPKKALEDAVNAKVDQYCKQFLGN